MSNSYEIDLYSLTDMLSVQKHVSFSTKTLRAFKTSFNLIWILLYIHKTICW